MFLLNLVEVDRSTFLLNFLRSLDDVEDIVDAFSFDPQRLNLLLVSKSSVKQSANLSYSRAISSSLTPSILLIRRRRAFASDKSSHNFKIELTCLSMILNSISKIVLEEFAILRDFPSKMLRLERLVEIEYAQNYLGGVEPPESLL